VDEFELAVACDGLSQFLGSAEVVAGVNRVHGFGVGVAYVNGPDRNFFTFAVLGWFGALISTGRHLRRIEPRA